MKYVETDADKVVEHIKKEIMKMQLPSHRINSNWSPTVTNGREAFCPNDIVEEILDCFKLVNPGKAVGPDGLNIKLLRNPPKKKGGSTENAARKYAE